MKCVATESKREVPRGVRNYNTQSLQKTSCHQHELYVNMYALCYYETKINLCSTAQGTPPPPTHSAPATTTRQMTTVKTTTATTPGE